MADWFVSNNGSGDNNGASLAHPWDLGSALTKSVQVQPGDRLLLSAQDGYRLDIAGALTTCTLRGTPAKPIRIMEYPGDKVQVNGYIKNADNARSVYYWPSKFCAVESRSVNPNRNHAQGAAASGGISAEGAATDIRFRNLVLHENDYDGIDFFGDGHEAYGCTVFNNGYDWTAQSLGSGHGFYIQNVSLRKLIKHCSIFHNFGWGMHAYTQTGRIDYITWLQNSVFASAPWTAAYGYTPLMLLGGIGAYPSTGCLFQGNMTWSRSYGTGYHSTPLDTTQLALSVFFAHGNEGYDCQVIDNVLGGPIAIQVMRNLVFTGNTCVSAKPAYSVFAPFQVGISTVMPDVSSWTMDRNKYWYAGVPQGTYYIRFDGSGDPAVLHGYGNVASWYAFSGKDHFSTDGFTPSTSNAPPTSVFFYPNDYDPNVFKLTIFNWAEAPSVSFVPTLGSILNGSTVKVWSVFDLPTASQSGATPVLSQIYNGGPLTVLMGTKTPPYPVNWSGNANATTIPPIATPQFGDFWVEVIPPVVHEGPLRLILSAVGH